MCHLFPKVEVLDRLGLFGDGNREGEVRRGESFLLIQFNIEVQRFGGLLLVRGDAGVESEVLQLDKGVGFEVAVGEFGLCFLPAVVVGVFEAIDEVVGGEHGRDVFEGIGPKVCFCVAVVFDAQGEVFAVAVGGRQGGGSGGVGRFGFGVIVVWERLYLLLVFGELSELFHFFGEAEVGFPGIAEAEEFEGLRGGGGTFERLRQGDGCEVVEGEGVGVEGTELLQGLCGFEGFVVVVFEGGFEIEYIGVFGLDVQRSFCVVEGLEDIGWVGLNGALGVGEGVFAGLDLGESEQHTGEVGGIFGLGEAIEDVLKLVFGFVELLGLVVCFGAEVGDFEFRGLGVQGLHEGYRPAKKGKKKGNGGCSEGG